MQKKTTDISEQIYFNLPVDSTISFKSFIDFINKKKGEEKTIKGSFYQHVSNQFEENNFYDQTFALEKAQESEDLLELIYSCLSPITANESNFAWGLTLPCSPRIFYGTDSLYQLLYNKDRSALNTNFFSKDKETHTLEHLQFVYSFILQRLYQFSAPVDETEFHACFDDETRLTKYYNLKFDNQFVEIQVNGILPEIEIKDLYNQLKEGERYHTLLKILPLELFTFKGFSIVTIEDITERQTIHNIEKTIINHTPSNEIENYKAVVQSLKNLVQDQDIEFELFSFFRVNDKLVYGYEKGASSLMNSIWGEKRLSLEQFNLEAQSYTSNPQFFYSNDINKEEKSKFVDLFIEYGVRSLCLNPIFLKGVPVGVLGIYTFGNKTFSEKTLAITEHASPVLAQLFKIYSDAFHQELEEIIKEKFTSIQSVVQWKFNEVAWHYLYNKKKLNPSTEPEDIAFKDVVPLYGAIDVRNSTIERNKAVKLDLQNQLSLLKQTLDSLKVGYQSSLLEEMIFKANKWLKVLDNDELSTNDESILTTLLNEDTVLFLKHVSGSNPSLCPTIEHYLREIDEETGSVFKNRREMESSISLINTTINNYLEEEKKLIQKSYPCYFEKFKSDGIEYDIYVGQSLTPQRLFSNFQIKDLRLWQLKSMAAIARTTQKLLPRIPKQLYTTQLIFAHNKTIDISFRADERRFDVEGAYNIRYQMIKKRIDKVLIKNSDERLTQPGKIALIYFSRNEIEDYFEFISYLQEIKILENNLEELALEDLQGVLGLKALRVGVVMN
jgi:hypothetical protein